ncbi:hypothetical protein BGZ94_006248, partial [Podila epigama]
MKRLRLNKVSEAETVRMWETLLEALMGSSSLTILRSSRRSQEIMNSIVGGDSSCSGRKCDLLFLYNELEVTNFEFKVAGASAAVLEAQRKKNVRLNRSILEGLKAAGFEAPAMLYVDIGGFQGTIFALVRYKGIYVCNEVAKIKYPETAEEFRALLDDGHLIRALSTLM